MPDNDGFHSPESAAASTFPPQCCRVIGARASGDYAYVLLDTGSIEYPYLYGVNCQRRNGRWFEGSDGNSPSWARNRDSDVGTQSFWGQAPVGADMVKIEFDGTVIEEPVTNGAYLAVWWNVPYSHGWPRLVAIRIAGRWRPSPDNNVPEHSSPDG
jgi:hypothetical protein